MSYQDFQIVKYSNNAVLLFVFQFDENESSLKVCPICLEDILLVAEHKKAIDEFSENTYSCSLCQSKKQLVSIKEWEHFDALLENINAHRKRRCTVCVRCIKFLELVQKFRVNFINKYVSINFL